MKLKRLLAALLCLLLLCACGTKAAPPAATDAPAQPDRTWPLTVTDDLGRAVTLDAPPERVAALIGSFAETWLLAGGTLAAAVKDAWDDFDLPLGAEVQNLGSYTKVSLEQLFAAEADLVIASGNSKSQMELRDTLERSGVPVLYFNVNGFEDYLRMLKLCCDITGRADLYEQNGLEVQKQVDAAV